MSADKVCGICSLPNVDEVNDRLIAGESRAKIAEDIGFSRSYLRQHARMHCGIWANAGPVAHHPKVIVLEMLKIARDFKKFEEGKS